MVRNFDNYPVEISKELSAAVEALDDGNEGKARVCARRAVGKAYAIAAVGHPASTNTNAPAVLATIMETRDYPPEVRAAARRLATSVASEEKNEISRHPVEDAGIIIGFLIGSI